MREISKEKEKFLNSIGIDINNLPPEFSKHSDTLESQLTNEEIDFLDSESLTGRYQKEFCLKDLVGTNHPDYTDMTWVEAFLASKRGDRAVEEYFSNPEYYSKDLKEYDQSKTRQETPLELYECDGKFFINGGNNRLSLIMMKYLAELSKANDNIERAKIDKKYTFVADVQSVPEDKDIMHLINMISKTDEDISIRRSKMAKDDKECRYTVSVNGKQIEISNKSELEQYFKGLYKLDKVKDIGELEDNLNRLVSFSIMNSYKKDDQRILNGLFPNIQQFEENFSKIKNMGLEKEIYDGIDLDNVDFDKLVNNSNAIIEREQQKRQAEIEKRKEEQIRERHEKSVVENRLKTAQRRQKLRTDYKKQNIESQSSKVVSSVEVTYYQLKEEEIKFSGIAKSLGLQYTISKVDDTDVRSGIKQIKSNMQSICEKVKGINDLDKLEKVSGIINELDTIANDGTITLNHKEFIKKEFEKSFDEKVQGLIKDFKLSKLETEKSQIESEKISLLGRMLGKGKLKQAKLDNVELRKQLLIKDNKSEKVVYSMEDSLSDLYAYSHVDLNKQLTPEMKEFLTAVKSNPEMQNMIQYSKVKEQSEEKVKNRNENKQLAVVNDGKVNSRQQVNLLILQNNDLQKELQHRNSQDVSNQNNLSKVKVDRTNGLIRFQEIVKEINQSTRIKDERQQQRDMQNKEIEI